MAKPRRDSLVKPVLANTVKHLSDDFFGFSKTLRKSAADNKRAARGNSWLLISYILSQLIQGASRERPLARLAFSRRLPPLVAIRERKPWVRARLRVLG